MDTQSQVWQVVTTGDMVAHPQFGKGRVEQIKPSAGCQASLFVRFDRVSIWVPAIHVTRVQDAPELAR